MTDGTLSRRAVAGLAGGLALTPARATISGAALVIGNGGYQWEAPLANPRRDAQLVGQLLQVLGLTSEILIDADRATIQAALARFAQRANGAQLALLFFAGHGIQRQNNNFLVPVDADLQAGTDAQRQLVPVNAAIQAMARAQQRVLILDACRNDPLAGASEVGLARIDDSSAGSLFCFATSPGRVALDGTGQNSPFTDALLDHLGTPGLELRQVLTRVRRRVLIATDSQQVPWDNSSLTDDVVLRGAGLPPVPRPVLAVVAAPVRPQPAPQREAAPAPTAQQPPPEPPARPPSRETRPVPPPREAQRSVSPPIVAQNNGPVVFDPQRYREIPQTYARASASSIPLPQGLLVQRRDADGQETPLAGSYWSAAGIMILLAYNIRQGSATFIRANNSAGMASGRARWFQSNATIEGNILTYAAMGTVRSRWDLGRGWLTAMDRINRSTRMLAPPQSFPIERIE